MTSRFRVLEILGPSSGGIRRHVATLASHLPDHGWEVSIAGPPDVVDGLDVGSASVFEAGITNRLRPSMVLDAAKTVKGLSRNVDVVHAHGLKAGLVALAARPKVPLVVTLHNIVLDDVAGRSAGLLRRIEILVVKRADAVIAVSPGIAQTFAGRRTRLPIRVMLPASEPPVPRRSRAEVRAEWGIGPEAPLVTVVARLHRQKALYVFVEAFRIVHDALPASRALIVGDGELRADLESWVARAGLEKVITMTGRSEHAVDEIAAGDVFALSSVWEGAPISVAEAMQLGRPVVSTDVGAIKEMIGSSGVVVPVGDHIGLADALIEVLSTPGEVERRGAIAQSRGRELYGTEPLVSRVAELYSEVRTS